MAWPVSLAIAGSPGIGEGSGPDPRENLVINEVGGHPTQPGSGFVELLNRGGTSIEIGGSRLSVNRSAAVVIQPGTSLAPGERFVVHAQNPDLLLDGRQSLIALTNAAGSEVLDAIRYRPNDIGTSFGRVPDGSECWRGTGRTFLRIRKWSGSRAYHCLQRDHVPSDFGSGRRRVHRTLQSHA